MCRAEWESVRANCENVDGAEARFVIGGADTGIDCENGGEERRV